MRMSLTNSTTSAQDDQELNMRSLGSNDDILHLGVDGTERLPADEDNGISGSMLPVAVKDVESLEVPEESSQQLNRKIKSIGKFGIEWDSVMLLPMHKSDNESDVNEDELGSYDLTPNVYSLALCRLVDGCEIYQSMNSNMRIARRHTFLATVLAMIVMLAQIGFLYAYGVGRMGHLRDLPAITNVSAQLVEELDLDPELVFGRNQTNAEVVKHLIPFFGVGSNRWEYTLLHFLGFTFVLLYTFDDMFNAMLHTVLFMRLKALRKEGAFDLRLLFSLLITILFALQSAVSIVVIQLSLELLEQTLTSPAESLINLLVLTFVGELDEKVIESKLLFSEVPELRLKKKSTVQKPMLSHTPLLGWTLAIFLYGAPLVLTTFGSGRVALSESDELREEVAKLGGSLNSNFSDPKVESFKVFMITVGVWIFCFTVAASVWITYFLDKVHENKVHEKVYSVKHYRIIAVISTITTLLMVLFGRLSGMESLIRAGHTIGVMAIAPLWVSVLYMTPANFEKVGTELVRTAVLLFIFIAVEGKLLMGYYNTMTGTEGVPSADFLSFSSI